MINARHLFSVLAFAMAMSMAVAADGATKMSDQDFAKEAASGGMFEVEAGKLATKKGGSEQVRSFGAQMIVDHQKANEDLKALAAKKGWSLPTKIDEKHQQQLDHLSTLSTAEFDRAYVDGMIQDHRGDLSEFQRASRELTDADLRAFAGRVAPMVEHHLSMIENASRGGSAAMTSNPPMRRDYAQPMPREQNNTNWEPRPVRVQGNSDCCCGE
ncbi:MAG TPA: DUF4142 domain-containing protein [Planctomycetota bacterium]|nr:DUF4142 domain-containing protein [Planctomycetota bacterium]